VRFRGVERRDVEEYCVSEGWIRAAAGKALDRRGQPLVIKMTGAVAPYFLASPGAAGDPDTSPAG
jgi:predicted house-cleaning NTP pyrophosphatase (Maf/HAM1 superfamily)